MKKEKKIGFKTGIISGFFGSGGGSYLVPKLEKDLDFSCKKAHASSIAIILPTCIFSIIIYLFKVEVNLFDIFCICIGGGVGGIFGSKFLKKIKSKLLNRGFSILLVIIGVRLIL